MSIDLQKDRPRRKSIRLGILTGFSLSLLHRGKGIRHITHIYLCVFGDRSNCSFALLLRRAAEVGDATCA